MFDTLFTKLAHLPVSSISEQVAGYFTTQMIPIVTSEVASGKTMLIPAACARALADDPIDPVVYVLQPTRFLSNNAAESLWSLLGEERNLVGVMNSNRSDDTSTLHPDNRVVFTTVGYALAAGILSTKSNFILDEAHETSIDLSLAKAYLHARLKRGDLINVAELSATIDVSNELAYWGDVAFDFSTKGSAFPVEFLHRPAFDIGSAVSELIHTHDRQGILVFVAGVEEIEEAVQSISAVMFRDNIDFEIETVHGNSTAAQRKAFSAMPKSKIKIGVGTNVLESGVSLPWVDGGVSSGDTKVMYARGNVRRLHKEELPGWRINQQMGRVARFKPGVFTLAHPTTLESRPQMAEPDIIRLPLTELVMNCTKYPDIHVRDLEFTIRESPKPEAITDAISTLVAYGLINEDEDGRITLTDDGRLVSELPLSYRAAAAVCEANKLGMVGEMLPLVAAIDMGDMRFDYRSTMYGTNWQASDTVAQLMVIAQQIYTKERSFRNKQEMNDEAQSYNVNLKKYFEMKSLVQDLERKTGYKAGWECYLPAPTEEARLEFDRLTKQVIFRAMIVDSYPGDYSGVTIPKTESKGSIFTSAQKSNTTSLSSIDEALFYSGNIRIVTPKPKGYSRSMPFAVIEMMTAFNEKDVKDLIKVFGRPALERIAGIARLGCKLDEFLNGKKKEERDSISDILGGSLFARQTRALYSGFEYASPTRFGPSIDDDSIETVKKEEPAPQSALALALAGAMGKK